MKISEKFIRIGLISMIGLSLYFSYAIWLSPAGKTSVSLEESNSQVVESQNYRKVSEIFLPLHLTWFKSGKIKETNSENLISQIHTLIGDARFGNLSEIVETNQEKFDQAKAITDGFVFTYNATFLLSEYKDAFGLNIDTSQTKSADDIYFNSVQFNKKDEKVRFVNYQQHTIYEASLSMDWQEMEQKLNTPDIRWTPMSKAISPIETQRNSQGPIRLKKYSYILSQQPYTVFRNAFFETPDKVKNNDDSNELIFYDGNETLTIHSANQIVDFRGELLTNEENANIFDESFTYVSKLGSALGNIRYFDRNKNQIDYRIFVEGFPVFGSESKGKISMEIGEEQANKQVNIQTSLNTIQVPIPSEDEVELPNTDDVFQSLIDKGAKERDIGLIIVGYTWQNIKETNRVVDLLPEWYVKYQDNWYSANDLLAKLSGTGAE
ncbi:hypothetical protein A5844_002007 [Enterococcus sp. 10A9_DIV0425]|uniref:Regulatory protein YycH domain-containing protein n=1 Tax=Candidatus Enterococcus wittei TaxID=1987383 RepID=A0A242JYB6_9ENTE|nr:two-component system activity regulator YycH [Enterococcus sp. 10A9_DIV0425]OTP10308.1 hypothetical protein A5844_002007 [Enterococcus sp. 10A9_DIV0425]